MSQKTILITGTSSGIGRASVKRFAALGWNVVATMRNPEKESELGNLANVLVTRLDVQDKASIDAAIEAGIAKFGQLDVLVNNAGFGQYGLFEGLSTDQIETQFQVNLFGVMDVMRAALPNFRARKSGLVINVSSGAGVFGLPMISAYCASKFALEGFSEAVSYELASQGIGVKLVIPHGGVAETSFHDRSAQEFAQGAGLDDYHDFQQQMTALFGKMGGGRLMDADYVAGFIAQAATDGSSQLRYYVGDDARGFVDARLHKGEAAYMAHMRSFFVPQS
ncbi:SDR family oxidoreductase [Thalassospira marina]|uniref:Short-chain dehydrogenase/reductase n=1 Tax=Thalassospira marina TaxID=2048283 RepID=A0ABM6QA55_9PROT|nr:SDR family oxidoreductase [Thalassospira marina]AUG53448.1 short-chain dehydrogenase/reductase [Thalassospira marina]